MDKKIILLFLFLVFINFASATFQQSSEVDVRVSCLDVNCSEQVNITIIYPNSSTAIDNQEMASGSGFVNYTFSDTTTLGEYAYFTDNGFEDSFKVTYTGKELSSASSTFYIVLFAIFIFLFIITLLGINKLPSSNATDEEGTIIKISYLKYLLPVLWFVAWMFIVAILYISSNLGFAYLEDTLFANFLFTLFKVSFGLSFPIVIMWFVWIFARTVDDKKIKNLWSRGMFARGI